MNTVRVLRDAATLCRYPRLHSRKERRRFSRFGDRTFTVAERIAHCTARVAHLKQQNKRSSCKRVTRELICLEQGIPYSPRRFRRLKRRLKGA